MWQPVFYMLLLVLSTLAIKMTVDGKEKNGTEVTANKKQDIFYISDEANVDSYLIPPDPHRPAEVLPDYIVIPATYLLPPSAEKQIDFYAPTEAGQQTDWYPIAQVPVQSTPTLLPIRQPDVIPNFLQNNQSFRILQNQRGGKAFAFPLTSRQLELPVENSPNDFVISDPAEQLQLPSTDINQPFNVPAPDHQVPIHKVYKTSKKSISRVKSAVPTLTSHLMPPKPELQKYKKATKLYPKKVFKVFQPIPIPISEFTEDTTTPEVPHGKPVKSSDESEYFTSADEKKIYLQQKRKLKGGLEIKLEKMSAAVHDTYGVNVNAPAEQETSETNYRHPGRNVYPVSFRQAPSSPPAPAPNERTEFHMHGMKGPHSYQFGFDTGKGKNRQFRYEERDDGGRVKGHYGFMDKNGKMRVVNYNADPETGFHAESPLQVQ